MSGGVFQGKAARFSRFPTAILVTCWVLGSAAGFASDRLCDVATKCERPEGAPKASDVIVRSLRIHPAGKSDPHDTMQALRDFHATTLAWAYINQPEFIKKVKQSGRTFGGAVSAPSYVGKKSGKDWMKDVAILNRRGEIIIAPWKRTWKPTLWGCVNNPELERGYVEYLKQYIDAGATIMQRDEPRGNNLAVRWGGCFCEHCMKGFREFLAEKCSAKELRELGIDSIEDFNYRTYLDEKNAPIGDAFAKWDGGELKRLFLEYQTEATIAFHKRTRAAIDAYAGRRVPFSCNNGVHRWGEVEFGFDWAFGELSYGRATAYQIFHAMREAAGHDREQIVTMPKKGDYKDMPEWVRRTRKTIAMAYACGGHCMVPWDTFMPHDAPRYFGKPEEYADLFGFIRANARYFDGYAHAEATGNGTSKADRAENPAVRVIGGEKVAALVRAVPGKPDAPVVIHLVDWSEEPGAFKVRLNAERFFGDRLLKVRLLRPAAYDRDAHVKAEESGDFSGLSREEVLEVGGEGTVEIPAVGPWGVLVVERVVADRD